MAKRPKISVTVRLREDAMAILRSWVDAANLSLSEAVEIAVREKGKRLGIRKPTHRPSAREPDNGA